MALVSPRVPRQAKLVNECQAQYLRLRLDSRTRARRMCFTCSLAKHILAPDLALQWHYDLTLLVSAIVVGYLGC